MRHRPRGLGYPTRKHDRTGHEASADAIKAARAGDCFNAMLALGAAYAHLDAGSGTDESLATNARAAETAVRARCEVRKRPQR
jgi:hypothetical protein